MPRPLIALALALLALSGCGGDDQLRVAVEPSGTCATNGTEIFIVLTSNEPLTADVRIEGGLLSDSWTGVEIRPVPVELSTCACTCAPGEPLGTVVVEIDGEVRRRIDLGGAGEACCESR